MDSHAAKGPSAERERLLAAARVVFARRAWTHVKVDGILREAGLSRRAFYRHFSSKDHLLLALLDQESGAAAARLGARSEALPARSPEQRVSGWIEDVLGLVQAEHNARRTSLFARLWGDLEREFPDELVEFRIRLLRPLVTAVEDGQQAGAFAPGDAHVTATAIYFLVSGFVRERATSRGTVDIDAAAVQQFVSAALRPPCG